MLAEAGQGGPQKFGAGWNESPALAEFVVLFASSGSDPTLENAARVDQVENAAHRTGMTPRRSGPFRAQVGVGIELDEW